jgi:hypothetical protein
MRTSERVSAYELLGEGGADSNHDKVIQESSPRMISESWLNPAETGRLVAESVCLRMAGAEVWRFPVFHLAELVQT